MPAVHWRARRGYHGSSAPVTPASGLVAIATRSADWHDDAVCREVGTEMFFDVAAYSHQAAQAKAICGGCPVRARCLEWALSFSDVDDEYGIFGGTSPRERKLLRHSPREEAA